VHFDHQSTGSARVLRPASGTGRFNRVEDSRRSLAIRVVTWLSAAGLLLVLAAWYFAP
jgi:hypothetical protein